MGGRVCQCIYMELFILAALTTLSPFVIYGVSLRMSSQRNYDITRKTYEIVLPTNLAEDRVQAFIRSIGSHTDKGIGRLLGVPTVAFETHYTDKGIYHRLRVPSASADYLIAQVHASLPGVDVTPVEDPEQFSFTSGAELGLSDGARTLRIANAKDMVARILGSVPTVETDEHVVVQWVISHSEKEKTSNKTTVKSSKFSFLSAVVFGTDANPYEVTDRKNKESEPNFTATGRVGVVASNMQRADKLITGVFRALRSENDDNQFRAKRIKTSKLDSINTGATPLLMGAQFTVTELTPVIAWPIGDPSIPGLVQGSTRRLPATEVIAREGWLLGHSNVPGRERPIAVDWTYAILHTLIVGRIGSGKSVVMANGAAQAMDRGNGVFLIDASASKSDQSLYNRVLSLVPPERVNDVITMNVTEDADHPVGFNLFDQGSGRGAIDQIVGVFTSLYPDIATGVSVRDLLYHGIWTLIEHGGLTIIDLAALIRPNNPQEEAWKKQIISGLKEQELIDFWKRIDREDKTGKYTEPLHRRIWQLAGRPEIRNILGQSNSSINLEDALANNKIVLVSLSGLPADSAELLGTLLMTTLWTAAQRLTPEKANFLYLDEFQVTARIQEGLGDVLNRARKHNLGAVLGTQYVDRLPKDLQSAILNNTGTRVVFETSAAEARIWQGEFGRRSVDENDFIRMRKHEAIATIATSSGTSAPVTLKALAPIKSTGYERDVLDHSRHQYGQPVEQVRQQIIDRRKPSGPTRARPKVGWAE